MAPLAVRPHVQIAESGLRTWAVDEPELVQLVQDLVRALSPAGRFPGPNPCSVERRDLAGVRDAWLCEKTDGTRVLLVFARFRGVNLCCVVTRAWEVFLTPLRHSPRAAFQGTVLDGELVTAADGGHVWLGFDAMVVCGVPVWRDPLSHRLDAARRCLGAYSPAPGDPVRLEYKRYFRSFREYAAYLPTSPFPADGTIVTPEQTPVCVGRHQGLLKLKDAGGHTVDFEFAAPDVLKVYDARSRGGVPVARIDLAGAAPPAVGAIVECLKRETDDAVWVLVKVRVDKTQSNDVLTYERTQVNARERMTLADLDLPAFAGV